MNPPTSPYRASLAFLPDGSLGGVTLTVDVKGRWQSVEQDDVAGANADTLSGLVLPGLHNLHSHAFQRALAGRTEHGRPGEDTFWTWRESMYELVAALDPEDVQAIAAQLYIEMLEAGFTRVVEFHYLHRDRRGQPYKDPAEMSRRIVAAAREVGIGLTLLPVVYDAGGFGNAPLTPRQRRFRLSTDGASELVEALSADAAVTPGYALHSLRAVSTASFDRFVEHSAFDRSRPVHIHVAEQGKEVEDCLAWSGARPVDWLLDHAPVGPHWCLIHATHVDRDEVTRLARSGATVGLCPTTEANLGDGFFPLAAYRAAGGRWGIGSDSHVSVSPVEELRWLEYGQRLTHQRRNTVAGAHGHSGAVLLAESCLGGGSASGVGAAFEPGASADLVVVDLDHPTLAGHGPRSLVDAWIFSGNRPCVQHVMVGGRWVVRDGLHPKREDVAARYREALTRTLARL